MQVSILIVSKNRKEELELTLKVLFQILDFSKQEILVYLDGCTDNSKDLKDKFDDVEWYWSKKSIGASAARQQLYSKAKGQFLIGLDDDAHPLSKDFILQISKIFETKQNIGIIAFQEIKGIFTSDIEALSNAGSIEKEFYTNEFIGCGFAIRKDVYNKTNGFPIWIDIYGEESCLSLEVLANGYDIIYSSKIKVNHRVNMEVRKLNKQNYFRFEKQLKNTTYYYLVYYKYPLVKILKLYWHNFRKYGLLDFDYFKLFFKTIFVVIINMPRILKFRKPVNKKVLERKNTLSELKF